MLEAQRRNKREQYRHLEWCSRCGGSGHSARNCDNEPLATAFDAPLQPEPAPIAGGYWIAIRPAFPADHPARRVPLGR